MSKGILFKTIMAFLVSVLMLFTFSNPAMADTPPEKGELYIHKYIGAETGAANNGTELSSGALAGAIPVNGVQFNLYRVDTSSGIPGGGAGYSYALNGDTLTVLKNGVPESKTYPVTSYGSLKTSTLQSPEIKGVIRVSNLDQGIYLVIEDVANSTNITNANTGEALYISSAAAPFLVAVPMTNPAGNGWLTSVHVYPKNEALSIEKKVDVQDAVAVGDEVKYEIVTSVPTGIKDAKAFAVTDELDEALILKSGTVKVYSVNNLNAATLLTENTHYSLSYDAAVGNTLKVVFTKAGFTALDGMKSVKVSFTAEVTAKILEKPGYVVGNEAKVDFINKDNASFEAGTGGGGPVIHTAAIEVTKVNENDQALNGAEFKIATSEANAKAGRFLRIDSADSKLYDYDASPTSKWATLGAASDYKIAPANKASFKGLKDTINGVYQTYYVVEVTAPATYNILDKPVVVAFNSSIDEDADYTATAKVTNSKGFVLPMTGGAGTIAFTVSGIVLLGLAAIVFISSRKKEDEDQIS